MRYRRAGSGSIGASPPACAALALGLLAGALGCTPPASRAAEPAAIGSAATGSETAGATAAASDLAAPIQARIEESERRGSTRIAQRFGNPETATPRKTGKGSGPATRYAPPAEVAEAAVVRRELDSGASDTRYLLFQIFTGGPHPKIGHFISDRGRADYASIVRRIKDRIGPVDIAKGRRFGFSIGPLAMEQNERDLRTLIRDSFAIALDQDMAIALHLDDYMFWKELRDASGRKLLASTANQEWRDWQGTPSKPLAIGWLPNVPLAPQLCFESRAVRAAVERLARDVVGAEVARGLERLRAAGKADLFAGVIVGWESNLADGYCSLTALGFSADNPPKDFDLERERVLYRHIARWSKGVADAGVPRNRIYTHIAPIPSRDFEQIKRSASLERIREIPQSTAFRAYWTAFNEYSRPGFSLYPGSGLFDDLYAALEANRNPPWAMVEGTNVTLGSKGGTLSNLPWETYLAHIYNHGGVLVNLFGGFTGGGGAGIFASATESDAAVTAYRKFLRGEKLVER